MWFEYNPQIIFCHFFRKLNLAIFLGLIYNNVNKPGGTLWAQLFLLFYTDSFETSLVFWSWSEDTMYACGLNIILRLFFVTFFAS